MLTVMVDRLLGDWHPASNCAPGCCNLVQREPVMNEGGPVIRFGVFEIDLQAGELRKQGLKIKLQEQPLQVLAMLLERSGQPVSREELQKKLWSADLSLIH